MFSWDPNRYLQFTDERGRPFRDLVARIGAVAPRRVLDLGCGDGGFTASLLDHWPGASTLGIEASAEMIDRAATHHRASLTFRRGDLRSEPSSGIYDVVISNAAFQWVPDHLTVMQVWAAALKPGAWFAFQVPGNFDSPSHQELRALVGSPEWADRLPTGLLRHHDVVRRPAEYAQLFLDRGWTVDAWETTYAHLLAGSDPVLDWMRGTGLRPVLAALSDEEGAEFTRQYGARLRAAYPHSPNGTFFEFRRVFCVARR